jgi:hypothetical protein
MPALCPLKSIESPELKAACPSRSQVPIFHRAAPFIQPNHNPFFVAGVIPRLRVTVAVVLVPQ